MALMNRTNNFGSRRNVYSRNGYKDKDETNSSVYSSGGIGVDIPQAFMDDETGYNAGSRRNAAAQRAKGGGGGRSWMVTFTILMIFVLVGGYSVVSYHERKMMKSQLLEQDATMRELEIDLSMKFDSQIKKLKDENGALQRKLTDQKKRQGHQPKPENSDQTPGTIGQGSKGKNQKAQRGKGES